MNKDEHDSKEPPLTGIDDLLAPFHEAIKPPERHRVGTEAEKIGLLESTWEALPFEGARSVSRVLALLAERYGWQGEREHEDAPIIALRKNDASVTLEPAGQLELSGAPLRTIHETSAELRAHLEEVHAISNELGIAWISMGFQPFATHADLPEVPKLRYGVMKRYLPTRGPRSLDMMRRTSTVQANLDYSSEADALRKLRVALALQPIVTAMFASSPYYEGKRGQYLSERAAVWLGMDPDRSGLLPFAWDKDVSFERYVEWALDVPMFLVKRGKRMLPNTAQTFRQFLKHGLEGERATRTDWETHINTLFPEARLKRTLEMRGADAQSTELTCALPALWKGLMYEPRALDEAEALVSTLDPVTVESARLDIATHGLSAQLKGKSVQSWAERTVEIANGGLERIADKNATDQDERVYLALLTANVRAGKAPANVLLEKVESSREDFKTAVVAATRIA
jgi:glutamate--cysteine ligase